MTGRIKQAKKSSKIVPSTIAVYDEASSGSNSLDGQLRVDTSEEEEPSIQNSCRIDSCEQKHDGPSTGLTTVRLENMEAEESDDDDNELIDKSVEKNIRSIALKNNLDHNSVRRILRKLVKNDHVLALVKIKEEEMIKLETIKGSTSNSVSTPSKNIPITRLRAKELNPNPTPMKQQISSETAMLIHQELNSDDEDDEYQPCEEDMHSDDNTTISDIDSQPRTPATPFQSHDNSGYLSPAYSKDGVFKVPKSLEGNETRLSNEEQEIVAQRTRSKVCMQATPIEEIESTFIPPDITLDMYDFDWEIDNVYKEFLTDMQKPMQHHIENDDDENDPEYVAADKEPIDREEHKMSRVSKKEVNDLLKEVWDMIGSIDFDETLLDNVTNELINEDKSRDLQTPEISLKGKPSPRPKKTPQSALLNNSIIPESEEASVEALTYAQLENVKISPKSEPTFTPNVMSTPSRDEQDIAAAQNLACVQTDTELITSGNVATVIQNPVTTTLTDLQSTLYIPQTTAYFLSDNNLYQINGVPCENGIIQMPSEPFPTVMPTYRLTTASTTEAISSDISQFVKIENINNCNSQISTSNIPMVVIPSNLTDDIKTQQMSKAFCAMEKRYAYLNDSNYEMKFDADQIGFTEFQRQLLNQQLRQHVQILTTNFGQTYGHPSLFRYADRFIGMLREIDEKYEEQKFLQNSAWNIWNLKPAILFCDSWIKTLSVDTKSNRKYLEFLNKELEGALEYRKKRMYRPIKLAKKLTNWIIESYAIIYPKLLPKCGYNLVGVAAKNPFVPSEDFIFAYRLENCFDQIHRDIEAGKIKKAPGLLVICNTIAAQLNCRIRTGDNIFQYVRSKKAKACPMNPIKYYFEYGKWPPMKHNLEPFDQNTIKPLKDMERNEIGNENWEKIVFSKSRLGKLHNKRLIENGLPPEYIALSDSDDSDVELLRNSKKKQTPQTSPRIKIIYKTASGKELQPHTLNYTIHVKDRELQQCTQRNSTVLSRISCLCSSADDCSSIGEVSTINETSFDPNQRLLSEFFPKITPNSYRKPSDYELYTKFRDVIEKFHEDYDKYKINIYSNELLLNIYNSIKTLDVYTQLLVDIKMNTNFQINLDNFTNTSEQAQSSLSISPVAAGSQKPFHQINSKILNDEREFNYAQNFYDKVRETFLTENNIKDFEAFQSYLINFNYEKDTVPELYYKMEKLFYPRHQALAELFITFLLPGHAAQVGKFYENFMFTNMATFINKLNTYYSRQPAQIRKIYSCLNDLSNEKDLSIEKIKQKILPLLKGNQILTDWFLQLFPSEPPLETPEIEYETIHVAKHQNDDGKEDNFDDYETIPPSEIVQDNEIQGCGIKYIQGRIYYGNRVLLPAKLSFLAYDVLPLKGTTPGKSFPDNQSIKSITDSDIDKIVECVHGFGMCCSERSVRSEDIIKYSDSETNSWRSDSAEGNYENINQSTEKTPKIPKRKYSGRSVSPSLTLSNNKESSLKEYVLCDKETLKQHAIRLNPILHGNKIQESENSIENSGTISKDESSDSSLKNSPKRQKLNLLSPSSNSNDILKHAVQKKSSPNQKNSTKKSQSEGLNKAAVQMPKPNSPAIKTAQKLKTLLGSDSSSDDDRPLSERLEQYRLKKMAASNKKRFEDKEARNENLKRDSLPPPQNKIKTRRQKKIIVEIEEAPPPSPPVPISDSASFPSTSTTNVNSISVPPVQPEVVLPPGQNTAKEWTRNEDKVILEAIDCGLTDEQELYDAISTYLTDRTYEEIVGRHTFLMDVLKQFQTNT